MIITLRFYASILLSMNVWHVWKNHYVQSDFGFSLQWKWKKGVLKYFANHWFHTFSQTQQNSQGSRSKMRYLYVMVKLSLISHKIWFYTQSIFWCYFRCKGWVFQSRRLGKRSNWVSHDPRCWRTRFINTRLHHHRGIHLKKLKVILTFFKKFSKNRTNFFFFFEK